MDNNILQPIAGMSSVFDDWYLNAKEVYLRYFQALPDISDIRSIDGEKMYEAFKQKFGHLTVQETRYQTYSRKKKGYGFDTVYLVLHNRCIVEFGSSYCDLLHDKGQGAFINEVTLLAAGFTERTKREPQEINLIVKSGNGLKLQPMEVKRTRLDLDLFYEDDFKAVDEVIRKRLKQKQDKGIVLLHGLPGTGKTTYLRHLIGKTSKRVLFLSPSIAGDLMNPDFLNLLIGNPNTVLVIEDAENIIMDRKASPNSSVSNLLNISDGMLSDCLNVQIICTFNSELTLVDSALLRKGRLIARYEFGRLGINKAQRLSDHLGYDRVIDRPMTVAEIANQHEAQDEIKQMRVLGFRREAIEN